MIDIYSLFLHGLKASELVENVSLPIVVPREKKNKMGLKWVYVLASLNPQ